METNHSNIPSPNKKKVGEEKKKSGAVEGGANKKTDKIRSGKLDKRGRSFLKSSVLGDREKNKADNN